MGELKFEVGFAGGMFAIFVPSPKPAARTKADENASPVAGTAPGSPVAMPLDLTTAQTAVLSMASILVRIEREAEGPQQQRKVLVGAMLRDAEQEWIVLN